MSKKCLIKNGYLVLNYLSIVINFYNEMNSIIKIIFIFYFDLLYY